MKRIALTLAALALSATAVMADPVFDSGDLTGAYVLNIAGANAKAAFNLTGVLRFDGVGHIVNTNSLPSYIINQSVAADGTSVPCRFNVMTPAPGEGTPPQLYTVSRLDSSVRIPLKYQAFHDQPAVCQSANGSVSTLAGTMVSPDLCSINVGGSAAAAGTLQKQKQ
jgi:hypothetical protein